MKKPLIVIGIVVLLLIVAVAAVPFLIDANRFKPELETNLSTALGRKVQIGDIQLSLLSGSVTVDNISISDDPAFSPSPFLQAKQLAAGVALMPLIFSKQLQVSSFTVSDPQINLLRNSAGRWNFSSLGGASKSQSSNSPSATNFSVQKITISNGTVTSGRIGAGEKTQTYQNVNVEVSNSFLHVPISVSTHRQNSRQRQHKTGWERRPRESRRRFAHAARCQGRCRKS